MSLKDEIQDILHPEKKDLHPPRAPIVSETELDISRGTHDETSVSKDVSTYSTLAIDFNAIAKASEFQRFIYWILTGQTFRGSNKALKMKMRGVQNKVQLVRSLPPDLLKELKEKIKKRRIE